MARFNTVGLDDLSFSMAEIAAMPDELIDDMLNAGADVIAEGQKRVGKRMGVHLTGVTLTSIRKAKKTGGSAGGRYIDVYPDGKNADGNRNAEVAFINEFGKKSQAPRPFMQTANEEYADEMVQAQYQIYDNYLKSKNL